MNIPNYAYIIWMVLLLVVTFTAGCTVGGGYTRRTIKKGSYARKR